MIDLNLNENTNWKIVWCSSWTSIKCQISFTLQSNENHFLLVLKYLNSFEETLFRLFIRTCLWLLYPVRKVWFWLQVDFIKRKSWNKHCLVLLTKLKKPWRKSLFYMFLYCLGLKEASYITVDNIEIAIHALRYKICWFYFFTEIFFAAPKIHIQIHQIFIIFIQSKKTTILQLESQKIFFGG